MRNKDIPESATPGTPKGEPPDFSPLKGLFTRKLFQFFFFSLFRFAALVNALALGALLFFIVSRGWKALSWAFLTEFPAKGMTEGGIFPCIAGTLGLSLGALLVALPMGVASAVYLHEYAGSGKAIRFIRFAIKNLAGIPSVVFGLFGLAFFCILLDMSVSLASGALVLGIMILPLVIGATEEALKTVPPTYREASLALGATRWQTVLHVVLPAAMPGILTGAILGLGRVAGETAPIMFTAAVFYTPKLPSSIMDPVMALPYHIYVLVTSGMHIEETRPLQYATALVLIFLVLGMSGAAVFLRSHLRRKTR